MSKSENPGSATEKRIGTKVWENKKLRSSINAITLRLYASAYAEVRNTWHCEESAVPYTRIYMVHEGTAWLSDRTQTFRMEPNRVYIIPTGVACSYHCDGIMRKLFFHVNIYDADRTDLLLGSQQIGCISVEPDFVERLLQHYRGNEFPDAAILQAQLLQLLGTYLQQYQAVPVPPPSYSEAVAKTIDYIRQHLSAKLRNEELAQQLFVSRTYLTDRSRKETGMSLGKFIDYQLMYEAQLRLCQTDDSIYAISQDLGFSNQCYFSRRFKQMYGLTPLQYRKQNR